MTLWGDPEAIRIRVDYLTAMGVAVTLRAGKDPIEWACGCSRFDGGLVHKDSFTVCARHQASLGVTDANFVEDDDTP